MSKKPELITNEVLLKNNKNTDNNYCSNKVSIPLIIIISLINLIFIKVIQSNPIFVFHGKGTVLLYKNSSSHLLIDLILFICAITIYSLARKLIIIRKDLLRRFKLLLILLIIMLFICPVIIANYNSKLIINYNGFLTISQGMDEKVVIPSEIKYISVYYKTHIHSTGRSSADMYTEIGVAADIFYNNELINIADCNSVSDLNNLNSFLSNQKENNNFQEVSVLKDDASAAQVCNVLNKENLILYYKIKGYEITGRKTDIAIASVPFLNKREDAIQFSDYIKKKTYRTYDNYPDEYE